VEVTAAYDERAIPFNPERDLAEEALGDACLLPHIQDGRRTFPITIEVITIYDIRCLP